MNYFGIRNSYFKKVLLNSGEFRIKKKSVASLAYDCKRHQDLFERYERSEDLNNSLYMNVSKFYAGKAEATVLSKMNRAIDFYRDIKSQRSKSEPIVVTSNGARLDGSHRAGILQFLNVKEVDVKEVYAPKLFLWVVGREAKRKRRVYDKYKGKSVFVGGKEAGRILYTDFVTWDPFSIFGSYYHVLDTGGILNTRRCRLLKN